MLARSNTSLEQVLERCANTNLKTTVLERANTSHKSNFVSTNPYGTSWCVSQIWSVSQSFGQCLRAGRCLRAGKSLSLTPLAMLRADRCLELVNVSQSWSVPYRAAPAQSAAPQSWSAPTLGMVPVPELVPELAQERRRSWRRSWRRVLIIG